MDQVVHPLCGRQGSLFFLFDCLNFLGGFHASAVKVSPGREGDGSPAGQSSAGAAWRSPGWGDDVWANCRSSTLSPEKPPPICVSEEELLPQASTEIHVRLFPAG